MKKSTTFLFLSFLLLGNVGFCQPLKLIKTFDVAANTTLKSYLDSQLKSYLLAEPKDVYKEAKGKETLILDLDNLGFRELSGELQFESKRVFEGQALEASATIANAHFFRANEKGIHANLCIFENFIHLWIEYEGDEFVVLTDAFMVTEKNMSGVLVVYKNSDSKKSMGKACGITESELESLKTQSLRQINSYDYCRQTKIACEIDNEWYSHWGSSLADANVATIMYYVNSYFYNQLNITVTSPYLYTWSSTDPYSSTTNGQTLVGEFRSYWNSNRTGVSRDGAILFTYRPLVENITGNPIGGQTYDITSSHLCNTGNSYAIIGENGYYFNDYYYWITAHELGHLAGAGHDSSSANIMWNGSGSIPNSTFLSSTKTDIWNYLYGGPDTDCLITGDIQMKRNGSSIDPYDPNYVCTFTSSPLSAPGNHSITWALNSNISGAYYSSTAATSATVYHGGSSGGFTVKASKSNACGTIDRYYPFVVSSCFRYSYYPNQTSSILNVRFEDIEYQYLPDEVYIVDDRGNRLLEVSPKEYFIKEENMIINDRLELDLSSLHDGIYYLKVYYASREKDQTDTHRIVKL